MAQQRRLRPRLKRMLPRSLLGRSLLILVSPLILLQIISTWIFYDRHYDTITKRLTQGIAGDVAAVLAMLDHNPSAFQRDKAFHLAERTMWLHLEYFDGADLPIQEPRLFRSLVEQKLEFALEERINYPFTVDTLTREEEIEIHVGRHDGVLRIVVAHDRLFSSTTYIFIMWMVGSSIVLFLIASIFMRNQVRPIKRLASAAESFGKGRDVVGFKPEGAAEVRQAAATFLLMKERISRQIQQRTEMLAGVSHDLRTPLTRIKLQLEMLGRSEEVADLKNDVAEMERMVEGYLAFARGEGTEQPKQTRIGSLLRDLVGRMSREGRTIKLDVETEITLPLRRESIRRCLSNLIGNALRYGPTVAVHAEKRIGRVEITIDDDGPGIPECEREDAFKPFYRLDRSRNPATGGIGLGLTIARDVVRNHGGDITLEESPMGGLRVRLWLPL